MKEKERLEARANKWADKGNDKKAEELKEKAQQVETITPIVQPIVYKVNGLSQRTIWKAKVTDISKLPDEYKLSNQRLLNSIAKSSKGKMKIDGVEMYEEKITISR